MWVVDIRHWINEKTEEAAAPQIRQNVEGIKNIIIFATAKAAGLETESFPECWQKIKRKRCQGFIIAQVVEDSRIYWKCSQCDFEGYVTGWNNFSCNKMKNIQKRLH